MFINWSSMSVFNFWGDTFLDVQKMFPSPVPMEKTSPVGGATAPAGPCPTKAWPQASFAPTRVRGTTNPRWMKKIDEFCRKNTGKFQVVLVCLRILVGWILFSIDSHFNPVHWTTELDLARCFNPMPRNYDATRSCKRANQQDAS